VLILVPGMGDDVQTFKAGVMEIADLFVINKSDRPGAGRVEQEVGSMLSITPRPNEWEPPILKTVATTGEGVASVRLKLNEFRVFGERGPKTIKRQRERWRLRLLALLRQNLFETFLSDQLDSSAIEALVDGLIEHRTDPYSVVETLIEESGLVRRTTSKGKS